MVSGSLCPLISFLDVSYSVRFIVRGSGPVGDNDLWHHHIGRFSSFFSFLFKLSWKGFRASKLGEPQSQLGGP